MVAGKSRVGNKQKRGRERDREQMKGERDGALERTRNDVGWKGLLEMTPKNLGINRINKHQSNRIQIDFGWFPNL
jgi:hypothetical protein